MIYVLDMGMLRRRQGLLPLTYKVRGLRIRVMEYCYRLGGLFPSQ